MRRAGRPSRDLGRWLPALLAAALPVVFIPILVDAYVLPRTTLVVAGACLGVAVALQPGREGRLLPSWDGLALPALAVVAAALAAAVASASVPLSLVGAYSRYESVVVRIAYAGLFLCGAALIRTQGDRRRVLALYCLGCGLAAAEAIWQAWTHSVPRPDGNLGQPNLLGALLAMALPLAFWLAFSDSTASVPDRKIRAGGWQWWPLLLLLAAGLAVSTSRSGWLGALAGLGALWVLSRLPRTWLAPPRVARAGVVLGGMAGCLALLWYTPLRNLNSDVGSARLHLWGDTARLVLDRPLTGWGEDSLGLVYGRYLSGNWEPGATFDRAHDVPLDLLASQGVLGLAALICFWGLFGVGLGRFLSRASKPVQARDQALVAAVAAALVAYAIWGLFNFDWSPVTGIFWLLAGTAWSAVYPNATAPSAMPGRPSTVRAWMLATWLGLALVAAAFGVSPLLADVAYYGGDPMLSTRLDPLQAQYRVVLAQRRIADGDLRGAVTELRQATRLGEYDPQPYVTLGDLQVRLGHPELARPEYQRALQLDPYLEVARQRLDALR